MCSEYYRIKRCESNSEYWNTGIEENKDIARSRKRVTRYIANILILSDPKKPENEGKVFLFKFGPKIFEKLLSAIKPEFEDEVSFDPFDFWTGAPFKLKIRKNEGYRNYDKSEFGDCCALFDNDEAIENVWKSEYQLSEFINPKEFKDYDTLKSKFNTVLQTKKETSEDTEFDLLEVESEKENKPTQQKKDVKNSQEESDDDFEIYKKLLSDE